MLFHFFSSLSCKRDKQCARGTRLQKKDKFYPRRLKGYGLLRTETWKPRTKARRWASKKYPDYSFKRETVRDWKGKYQKAFESNEEGKFFALPRQGTPSKMSDELTTEVKSRE